MRSRRIQIVTKMIYIVQPETVKRRKLVSLCLEFDVMLSRWAGVGGGGGGHPEDGEDVTVSAEGDTTE